MSMSKSNVGILGRSWKLLLNFELSWTTGRNNDLIPKLMYSFIFQNYINFKVTNSKIHNPSGWLISL